MIQVRSLIDFNQQKKLNKFALRNNNATNRIVIMVISFIVSVLSIIRLVVDGYDRTVASTFITAFILFITFAIILIFPNMLLKPNNISDITYIYTFGYTSFDYTSSGKNISSNGSIDYNMIIKIAETKECFYIFFEKRQVHVIDKSGFISGNEEELRALLMQVVPAKKYKRYK